MKEIIIWLNTNQGFVMTVLTAVYVIATFVIASMAKSSNDLARRNIDTLTKLEKERLKPAIVAEILADIPLSLLTVRVANQGQTTALNIRFEFNPKVRILLGKQNMIPHQEVEQPIGFLEDGIASLPPGSARSSLIGQFKCLEKWCPELIFRGNVKYQDREGITYEEEIVLDARNYKNSFHPHRKNIDDVAQILQQISRDISSLTTGSHKPQIVVQSYKEYQKELKSLILQAQLPLPQASVAASEPAPIVAASTPQG